ncbi:serine recombinase [Kocuria dechangensis]|uniref:Serine recombinase n=1 Tax=Kocuria dechangensis TaxID=1176249 RepID=A0A917LQA5_9MICC|nr:recombinase family protein [Kocuria dechangensis]GGG49721.1 serine recombinase [Kocuria dechangensis]
MTKTRSAVAIYARISQDRTGEELGVKRQLQDCRAEAERRGWTVAQEYVDDDISAYSGKKRPEYERMLRDIAEGRRDGVIVWHMDRLHRRPIELERFAEICGHAELRDVVTPSGDVDLVNGDGLLMARLLAAVAANESNAKSRRISRKSLEIAQSGRPTMGGPRPFGFLDDRVTHHPAEAPVIRQLTRRALAGETLISLVTWLQDKGVTTTQGKEWRTNTVRTVLTNPRMWGMRVHQGQVIGKAVWEPIITEDEGERLRRKLLDPARRTNRSARRYPLSGMLECGKCGNRMHSHPRGQYRRYGCLKGPDSRGCGGIFIYAERLEEFIAEAVLYRLDSPELHRTLTEDTTAPEEARALEEAIEADAAKLNELAEMWADGEITRAQMKTMQSRVEARLETNRRAFSRLTHPADAAEYIGQGQELRAKWHTLNLSQQVAIIKAVLHKVTILPATTPGRHGLDPNRVVPEWRL